MIKTQTFLCFLLIILSFNSEIKASNIVVDVQTSLVDRSIAPFNQLVAGDTIFFAAGKRDNILIRNFHGEAGKPFIFINKDGVVEFDTDHNYAISVQNCRFFTITGTGTKSTFYGIQIERVLNGTGIGVGGLSSDFEIDHIQIKNVPIAGIYAKTDPDCSGNTTREYFTQFNTIIHDNYIENAGNEGLYVGSTKYFGQTVNCNGKDTLLMPSVLEGVKIYNNIIKNSGWDGIQVSSATRDCQVYGNQILNDSEAGYTNQMSGIIIGGGSKCDCYNNLISDGKGDGIEIHGLGGNHIFNNIIVNAGKTYFPGDFESSKMKHGIFVTDVSVENDSSFFIQNNTIINPKSDGIRFSSVKSKNNLIASNAIINPGNFNYYETGNTQWKGQNSYVMIPNSETDILLKNNYFELDISKAVMADDFSLLKGSPLIDAGYTGQPVISFDFLNNPRGNSPDIGAYEYDSGTAIDPILKTQSGLIVFPNPAKDEINFNFQTESEGELVVSIYNLLGTLVKSQKSRRLSGKQSIKIDLQELPAGIYLYSFRTNSKLQTERFVKTK